MGKFYEPQAKESKKYSAFGKPTDVDAVSLGKQADKARREMDVMPSTKQYEQESHFTPRWLCPCGRDNECAVTSCNQCGRHRPELLHGDPAQGDSFLGLARRIARGQTVSVEDRSQEVNKYVDAWNKNNEGYEIGRYKFDTERPTKSRWVGWQDYVSFLQGGGTV